MSRKDDHGKPSEGGLFSHAKEALKEAGGHAAGHYVGERLGGFAGGVVGGVAAGLLTPTQMGDGEAKPDLGEHAEPSKPGRR